MVRWALVHPTIPIGIKIMSSRRAAPSRLQINRSADQLKIATFADTVVDDTVSWIASSLLQTSQNLLSAKVGDLDPGGHFAHCQRILA